MSRARIPEDARERLNLNGRQPEPATLERVLLGRLLRDGIEPTPQLVEDLMYAGRMHSIAGEPGTGKTLLAVHLSDRVMRAGGRVLYFDAENGPRAFREDQAAARTQEAEQWDLEAFRATFVASGGSRSEAEAAWRRRRDERAAQAAGHADEVARRVQYGAAMGTV